MKKQEFIERLIDDLELEVGEITDENSMLQGLFSSLGFLDEKLIHPINPNEPRFVEICICYNEL